MIKDRSPFSPGQPVSPPLFVGRQENVNLLTRAIRQAGAGNPQYVFITGERGIGKSSLASLAREIAEKEYGFVGAHALLGGAQSLGEVCRRLYQSLVSQLPEKPLIDKARRIFERYVEKVDLFGLGVEFKKDDHTRSSLVENFIPLLAQVREAFADEKRRGIVLIADDLNGISQDAEFAHFLKSTVDQIAVGPMRNFPWVFILVGVPERMEDLKKHQPSIDRIFQVIELPLMSEAESVEFYKRAFESVGCGYEVEALQFMAGLVGGYPVLWHELGDAVFWQDQDNTVTMLDAVTGLGDAVQNVGRKYLQRPLYDELRSPVYRNILRYIAGLVGGMSVVGPMAIRRADALAQLAPKEAKNFDNFINRMRDWGVITLGGVRGQYVFTNSLYGLYVVLQSAAEKRGGTANVQKKEPGSK